MNDSRLSKDTNLKKQITAVIVGAGHRSLVYASYALKHPDEFKITGVVDPNEIRRNEAARIHGVQPKCCFESVDEFLKAALFAGAVINGTMDKHHIPTSLPLLEAGYHLLLEKPIGVSQEEVLNLLASKRKNGKVVMICHVLRYAPFYKEIHKRSGSRRNRRTDQHTDGGECKLPSYGCCICTGKVEPQRCVYVFNANGKMLP